jgi:UDPglucose--hexose-1-phosphate uridylyltransferase
VKKTAIRLADGRELIYYDERDDAVRDAPDRRPLAPHRPATELRYDVTVEEWVAIATHRQERTHLPPTEECPLCPSRGDRSTEIPASNYDVVVFENRFPAFSVGIGRCEVVCFTDQHATSFAGLGVERARTVNDVWADRTLELGAVPGTEHVFCFENRGEEIGVTLHHPHGQIYGFPFDPPVARRMVAAARRHQHRTGRNLFADVLEAERASGDRVVVDRTHWTAFVPAAARWPFEIHAYPKRHVLDFPALTDDERDDLAALYIELLGRLDGVYDVAMPYIAAWHQAPVRHDRPLGYLHLRLFSPRRAPGKLKYLAGSEAGMGAFVNDIVPETAARLLREASP